jgi:hydrogenase maturation protease
MKTLILGLGNDLLSDDAAGIIAARRLRDIVNGSTDVIECCTAGISLLDVLVGYDRVIILDSYRSGDHPAGTVIEMSINDLEPIPVLSPHYAGLPEVISIGRHLGLSVPVEISIIAVEISDRLRIGGTLSKTLSISIDRMIHRTMHLLRKWEAAARTSSDGRHPAA